MNRFLRLSAIGGLAIAFSITAISWSQDHAEKREALFETFDLSIGESIETRVGHLLTLLSISEPKGEIWGEIAKPQATISVNGEEIVLVAGTYRLPVPVGGIQIDCPITGGLRSGSHKDHWALEKDARIRVWSNDSPWIDPGTFGYPLKQRWFASHTAFSNEPVSLFAGSGIYYHAGMDFGGCEGLIEVVAATDALVVSAGNRILEGHEPLAGSPVAPRYDVLYLLDERGWYYRYSHLHSFDPAIRAGGKVKKGQRLGLLGKEGASGGWSHLHFEIKNRQPSGKWGTEDSYAFLWQGYRELHDPDILAVARPGHLVVVGGSVTHDGSRSWTKTGGDLSYRWTFSDGTEAEGAVVEKRYERSGTYSETLRVTDSTGNTDVNFVRVRVFEKSGEGEAIAPPRVHATYHPTVGIRPGDPVTFKARCFGTTHGEEIWDFGDGSEAVATRSDGNEESLNPEGYAAVVHRFEKPGDYIVHVVREDEKGHSGEDRLFVRVRETKD